jgi:protein-S-isoprenylcysteine O-methyltransferase Ste14
MDYLRIVLFAGLVFHKALWVVLKNRDGSRKLGRATAGLTGKWFIKAVKALVFAFIAFQTLFLNVFPIVDEPSALRLWGALIYFVGLGTAVLGRVHLGENWVDLEDYQVLPTQSVTTNGIYRYLRHPIYTGDILVLVGLELALNSWLVLGVVIPVLVIVRQALAEEALLAQVFPSYRAYCRQTKRFIPFVA